MASRKIKRYGIFQKIYRNICKKIINFYIKGLHLQAFYGIIINVKKIHTF